MNKLQKIPLLCFVVLTVVVSLAMAVMDVQKYISYSSAKDEIETLKQEIESNRRKKPSYNDNNRKKILQDAEKLKVVVEEFKLQYGKPHRKALQQFAKAVGTTEEKIIKDFAAYYNELPDNEKATFTDKNDKKIWDGFKKRLYCPQIDGKFFDPEVPQPKDEEPVKYDKKKYQADKKNVEAAFAVFADYAKKFVEYEIPETQYKCMLDALGLPLSGEYRDLEELLNRQKYWMELIPGLKDRVVSEGAGNRSDSNKDQDTSMKSLIISKAINSWNEEQLSLIYRQIQIKRDLYQRMKDSKIANVHSVMLEGAGNAEEADLGFMPANDKNKVVVDPLKGTATLGGSFLTYSYRMKFSGTMESVRAFFSALNNAHKDYIVYNIRDVKLTREFEKEKIAEILKQNDTTVSKKEGQEVPDSYGKVVIGRDLNIECEVLVDYIMYVQNLIPRQQVQQQ